MKFFFLSFLFLSLLPLIAHAAPYRVDPAASHIRFAGKHAGQDFDGVFEKWDAVINFDPTAPENSKVTVTIDTSSAKTGNAMYDGTLPNADWFDVKNHATATFVSTSFAKADSGYTVTGDLTIRNVTRPVTFAFTLDGNKPTVMQADLTLNRLDFGIGANSDPSADWVDDAITLSIKVTAQTE